LGSDQSQYLCSGVSRLNYFSPGVGSRTIDPDGTNIDDTFVFEPKNIRSVNAMFDPAKADSSDLLASVSGAAPYLAGAAALGSLAPEDAEAGVEFISRRQSKRDTWRAQRQDLMNMLNSANDFVNNIAMPALDKPLQGYMGLAGVAGTLASGGSFGDAIRAGAQNAQRPTDQTAYQYGGSVTDTTAPYLPPSVAAGLGTAVQTGIQFLSPL